MIRVDVLINDGGGHFTGRCSAVSFTGSDGEPFLELEGDLYTERDNPRFRWIDLEKVPEPLRNSRADSGFKLGREYFACNGWRSGGNWCWESTRLASVDALRLANCLRELKYWTANAGESDVFDAWRAHEPISIEVWQKAGQP